jgi:hypothetical protein
MHPPDHIHILKRAGTILLVVGVIDIGIMIYCITNGIAYTSSLNIFAVIGGIFLLKGNLRAASIIRWGAVFLLSALLSMLAVAPLLQPFNLTLTAIRLNPAMMATSFGMSFLVMALLWWLSIQLAKPPVLAARAAAGRKTRSIYIPAILGAALTLIFGIAGIFMQRSDSALKATALVEKQLGASYRYHVSSLSFKKSSEGDFVSGVVTAWNPLEIKNVPFQWQE